MKVVFLAAVMLAGGDAKATECPPPPKLTCEQLQERIAQRCPQVEAVTPVVAAPRAESKAEIKYVDRVKIVEVAVASEPVPRGSWFAGAGPIYSAGWGGQAAVGYAWANGWMLLAGPNVIDHDSYAGSSTNCKGGGGGPGGGCPCVTLPYAVDPGTSWGGGAMLMYRWK